MRELAAMFVAAGCSGVKTYLQSGNVVFEAEMGAGEALGARISGEIERGFGLRVPVVVLTAAELLEAARANPFVAAGAGEEMLQAYFLSAVPAAAAVRGLDIKRGAAAGDSFVVRGRVIYLHLPGGMARSRLTNAYFDKALGVVSTCRNWRTVVALAGMVARPQDSDPSS